MIGYNISTPELSMTIGDIDKQDIGAYNESQFQVFLPAFILLCGVLIIGTPGNILAIFVYKCKLRKHIGREFLITLCVCDLLSCLLVGSFEMDLMRQVFDYDREWVCKLFRFFSYSVNNVSSIILLVIAVERYRVICCPWKAKFSSQASRRICYLCVLASTAYASPMFIVYGTQTIPLRTNSTRSDIDIIDHKDHVSTTERSPTAPLFGKTCQMDDDVIETQFPLYISNMYLITMLIEFILLLYLYSRISLTLMRRRKESMCQQTNASKRCANKRVRKVTLTAIVLTLFFVLCYLPCLVTFSIRIWMPKYYSTLSVFGQQLFELMLKFYQLDSAVNPFIYCFCNQEFRGVLLKYLQCLTKDSSQSMTSKEVYEQTTDKKPASLRVNITDNDGISSPEAIPLT
ncbi:tachykinin-like peptides receptor 99D [Dreissena polymorpha]|uniref:G-protein coupled receptors family 1 profile domain-containing protein n=1 Tax=Dreissena polymorpha TaxID=45954 RepID=A0A9D4LUF2_DREPO|nr:tachykinin-like peptides receptor 99D [Dreissena polymorpha]KAH3863994.1 hypothetical protein DPMN_027004 [Dreissena polymorpha]